MSKGHRQRTIIGVVCLVALGIAMQLPAGAVTTVASGTIARGSNDDLAEGLAFVAQGCTPNYTTAVHAAAVNVRPHVGKFLTITAGAADVRKDIVQPQPTALMIAVHPACSQAGLLDVDKIYRARQGAPAVFLVTSAMNFITIMNDSGEHFQQRFTVTKP